LSLALSKELQDKIREVEARAEWLKSQRLVVQEYALNTEISRASNTKKKCCTREQPPPLASQLGTCKTVKATDSGLGF